MKHNQNTKTDTTNNTLYAFHM